MSSNFSAFALPLTVSVVFGTTALVGVVEERPFDRDAAIRNQFDQPIVEIELDHLSLPLTRNEPFSSDKIPRLVQQLDSKRIRIRGYMIPGFEETGITEFMLSGETGLKGYSWGAEPPIHYIIDVFLRDGLKVEYDQKPFIVEGTLRLKPELAGGKLMTLFRLGDATLKRTKPLDGFHSGYGFGC